MSCHSVIHQCLPKVFKLWSFVLSCSVAFSCVVVVFFCLCSMIFANNGSRALSPLRNVFHASDEMQQGIDHRRHPVRLLEPVSVFIHHEGTIGHGRPDQILVAGVEVDCGTDTVWTVGRLGLCWDIGSGRQSVLKKLMFMRHREYCH